VRTAYFVPLCVWLVVIFAFVSQLVLALAVAHRRRLGEENAPSETDEWLVGPWGAIVAKSVFFYVCFRIVLSCYTHGEVSPKTGLPWEAWTSFIVYSGIEMVLQALIRGLSAPADLPWTKYLVVHRVILAYVPFLSPRIDVMKDLTFVGVATETGMMWLGALASFFVAFSEVWAWTNLPRRIENRRDHLILLRPLSLGVSKLPPAYEWTRMLLKIAVGACTPLKHETSMIEDCPQALLQWIYVALKGGSSFVFASAVIAAVKVVFVGLLAVLLAGEGETPDLVANLLGSPISYVREKSAEALASVDSSQTSEAVEGLAHAMANERDKQVLDKVSKGLKQVDWSRLDGKAKAAVRKACGEAWDGDMFANRNRAVQVLAHLGPKGADEDVVTPCPLCCAPSRCAPRIDPLPFGGDS